MSLPRSEEPLSHPGKTLREHLAKVGDAVFGTLDSLPLDLPFPTEILSEVGRLVGYYHDLGKATTFFQDYLAEQNLDRRAKMKARKQTNHSLLSGVAAYFAVLEFLTETEDRAGYFEEFLPIAAFLTVRRHHTNLEPAFDDLRLDDSTVIREQIEHLPSSLLSFLPYWPGVWQNLQAVPDSWSPRKLSLLRWLKKDNSLLPYVVLNLLYSALLDGDKHEAALVGIRSRADVPVDVVKKYRITKGFDKPENDLGVLRNEISAEVLAHLDSQNVLRERVLSLTAPTGAGKTVTVLDFALNLRNCAERIQGHKPRIIYALPFLSIIDQNAKVVRDVITMAGCSPSSDTMLVHHHLSDYTYRASDEEYGADQSEVLIEGWDSEIIITTFAQLFHTLFNNRTGRFANLTRFWVAS